MQKTVGVFGASGFVGTSILKYLRSFDVNVEAFSRQEDAPGHLKSILALENFRWVNLEEKDLTKCDSVVISIGSAPVPTWNKEQFDRKVFENGHLVAELIDSAEEAGVKNIVLISASMPNQIPLAYKTGKIIAKERLREFTNNDSCLGTVLAPNVIYGTRHELVAKQSLPIPLTPVFYPANLLLKGLKKVGISKKLEDTFPSVFTNVLTPFVSVSEVGYLAAKCAAGDIPGFTDSKNLYEFDPEQITQLFEA